MKRQKGRELRYPEEARKPGAIARTSENEAGEPAGKRGEAGLETESGRGQRPPVGEAPDGGLAGAAEASVLLDLMKYYKTKVPRV